MLCVRQTVRMPERDLRVSVQGFEWREIKRCVGLSLRGIAWNDKRKDLSIRAVYSVIEWSFEKFLPSGRPEQPERNVPHFLELTQILEGCIEDSAAHSNARFPRSPG